MREDNNFWLSENMVSLYALVLLVIIVTLMVKCRKEPLQVMGNSVTTPVVATEETKQNEM